MEFDFSTGDHYFDDIGNQRVNYFTLMFNGEFKIFRNHDAILFGGFGVSIVHFVDLGYTDEWGDWVWSTNDNIETVVLKLGLKFPITKKLFTRTEVSIYSQSYYEDEYYDDTQLEYLSSSFSFGLELHF